MKSCPEDAVAPNFQQVSNVDQDAVGNRGRLDPWIVNRSDLQAAHIILVQEGYRSVVGVLSASHDNPVDIFKYLTIISKLISWSTVNKFIHLKNLWKDGRIEDRPQLGDVGFAEDPLVAVHEEVDVEAHTQGQRLHDP